MPNPQRSIRLSTTDVATLNRGKFTSGELFYAKDGTLRLYDGRNTGGSSILTTAVDVGTVHSVGLSAPSIFTVSGGPVTSSGTLALTYSGTALPQANGGTGFTTYTAGQLLIGNDSGGLSANQLIGGANIAITPGNGTITIAAATYTLPPAQVSYLGGVRVDGTTITVDSDGVITAAQYSLPIAGTGLSSTLGGVRVDGTTITIDGSGVISGALTYTLPTSDATTLGGVIVPAVGTSGITNTAGTIGLARATTTQLGGVIVPMMSTSGMTNNNGTIGIAVASNTQLGGVIVDGSSITINGSGQITATVAALTYGSRTTISTTTASLAVGVAATANLSISKAYILMGIQVSAGAWVSVYSSAAAMAADASRTITTDPTPGSGVLAEAITTTATTTYFTPAIFAWNNDTPTPGTSGYLRITNNGASTTAITVTLTYLRLE